MKIHCRLCGQAMESADNTVLGEQMARHLIASHRKEAAALKDEIKYAMMLLSGMMLTVRYVDIPKDQFELRALFEKTQHELLELLGMGAVKAAN